ncbi:methylenetetrahydrofolate reductase [Salinicoccus halitifaciens]|uniref:Methylenetetrahydrofolate reductase n=1 Tax=Salinicoccus halitifaciens TaxID=1073415 RepID=A0ABV2ECR8_9STAP|nr:methylenetetrahydrofolate reductase [Salinicoccus halitifaciens]MCD2137588.1 methylenetetrahydrofolate reductase [Salinicoccus halitifaciens]
MKKVASNDQERRILADLLDNIGYEVMPFKNAVEKVTADVPTSIPLTVTATGDKGLESTLEVSISLREKGYKVAPHIPARLVTGPDELDQIIERLRVADIDQIFIIAGDAKEPAGKFKDSLDMLKVLNAKNHHFKNIGIGGYPEGHALFEDTQIEDALKAKSPYADRILTQICFSADTFIKWNKNIQSDGVELPVYAGMPGPISRQKLIRISAGLGLGQSANFLKKQQNMFWKFFTPSGYNATNIVRGLVRQMTNTTTTFKGFHIFTFNDFESTEKWRKELLKQTGQQSWRLQENS